METKRLIVFVCFLAVTAAGAQVRTENTAVSVTFTEKAIFLNEAKCFNYTKKGNDFSITDSNGKEIIKGVIRKNLHGTFESIIMFVNVAKPFTNTKIVGRNDLILSLVNSKVIGPDCNFDIDKLNKFIEARNGL